MSGDQASTGQDMLRGATLAATKLNTQGGVLGRQVKVLAADDRAEASEGAKVADAMVKRNITAVVGPFNSSVGVANLSVYQRAGVVIARLTSNRKTEGFGVTTQPMDSQVAPVEQQELVNVLHARSVGILYDGSTYTVGISRQLRASLGRTNVPVPVFDMLAPGGSASVALAHIAASRAEWVYLGMYGPEAGAVVAQMSAMHLAARCFVDLAAQGPDFVQTAGVTAASRCISSGVPAASQLSDGGSFVSAYVAMFHQEPGTWGPFAYDSVLMLAGAAKSAGSWTASTLAQNLDHTTGFHGVTGTISIDPGTGDRLNPPVVMLDVTSRGNYVVDPTWAAFARYPLPAATSGPGG
jgi:ABC-type branched-subunit amino acid transport system substrate-binding protein